MCSVMHCINHSEAGQWGVSHLKQQHHLPDRSSVSWMWAKSPPTFQMINIAFWIDLLLSQSFVSEFTDHVGGYRSVVGAAQNISDERLVAAFADPQIKHLQRQKQQSSVSTEFLSSWHRLKLLKGLFQSISLLYINIFVTKWAIIKARKLRKTSLRISLLRAGGWNGPIAQVNWEMTACFQGWLGSITTTIHYFKYVHITVQFMTDVYHSYSFSVDRILSCETASIIQFPLCDTRTPLKIGLQHCCTHNTALDLLEKPQVFSLAFVCSVS